MRLACALGLGLCSMANAEVSVCFTHGAAPVARAFVTHHFAGGEQFVMTDHQGCVSIFAAPGPTADVTVHAHNPVVRLADPVTGDTVGQRLLVQDGSTVLLAQGVRDGFDLVGRLRDAYGRSLRSLAPWSGREFPHGVTPNDTNWIELHYPDASPSVLAFVEPQGVFTGFPIVHLKDNSDPTLIAYAESLGVDLVPNTDGVLAHEFAHALHFAELSPASRDRIRDAYLEFLATDSLTHAFDMTTTPMVAYVEAFAMFAQRYAQTAIEPGDPFDLIGAPGSVGRDRPPIDREAAFYEVVEDLDGFHEVLGGAVEGAVFTALFYDYAKSPGIGLAFVVETVVGCDGIDVYEYADCIDDEFGADSTEFLALVAAGRQNGILIGDVPWSAAERASDAFATVLARGDFNGDGLDDVAIGAPGDDPGVGRQSGAVYVYHGSRWGLWPAGRLTQAQAGAVDESGDEFGAALTAADLDGDGFDDLAVGVPGERVGSVASGYLIVFRGGQAGLRPWQRFSQTAIGGGDESGDRFGAALAAADFDDDGVVELAIGSPGEAPWSEPRAGFVQVVALNTGRPRLERRFSQTGFDEPRDGERFGAVLLASDLDGDGVADLAAAAPANESDGRVPSGAVFLFRGPRLDHFRTVSASSFGGPETEGAEFGAAMSIRGGPGLRRFLIGAPGAVVGRVRSGRVFVMRGVPGQIAAELAFDVSALGFTPRAGERFGAALAQGQVGAPRAFVSAARRRTPVDGIGVIFELSISDGRGVTHHRTYRSPDGPGSSEVGASLLTVAADEVSTGAQLLIGAPVPGSVSVFSPADAGTALRYRLRQVCTAQCTWR